MKLPTELMFEIIEKIDIFDLDQICKTDTHWRDFCKTNNKKVIQIILKKYGVAIRATDNLFMLRIKFRILFQSLKENKFYTEEFPKLVLNIVGLHRDKKLTKIDKNIINNILNRDYTKYEFMVINDTFKENKPSIESVKHSIKFHIYRFKKQAMGNPFSF